MKTVVFALGLACSSFCADGALAQTSFQGVAITFSDGRFSLPEVSEAPEVSAAELAQVRAQIPTLRAGMTTQEVFEHLGGPNLWLCVCGGRAGGPLKRYRTIYSLRECREALSITTDLSGRVIRVQFAGVTWQPT